MSYTGTQSIQRVQTKQKLARHPKARLLAIAGSLLVLYILSGCAATKQTSQTELIPITDSPTGIYHEGKFVWNDLITDDVVSAKAFYGPLFGWTFVEMDHYTVIENNSKNIGGMYQVESGEESHGAARWLSSLSVADVDEAVDLVVEEGGQVHEGPLEMLNRGRGALVRDPQGAHLVLIRAKGGDPEDKEPPIGSWLWHELWSNKIGSSMDFYEKLIGYDYDGDLDYYLIMLKEENWRAGIRYSANSELEMRWVPVVRVADTNDIVARTEQLGGKVVVEPWSTEDGHSVALLSDPSDALLLIQRWSPDASKEEQ
jgi:predicted enzyme related to lactoylglutathione lyase